MEEHDYIEKSFCLLWSNRCFYQRSKTNKPMTICIKFACKLLNFGYIYTGKQPVSTYMFMCYE